MKVILLVWGFLAFLSGMAQSCLPEGVIFLRQAQIDSFPVRYPGCTEIQGGVIISGVDITNLDGLGEVTRVGGELHIGLTSSGNPDLASLSGLSNLKIVGDDLFVIGNDALASLTGLEQLAYVGGSLFVGEWYDGNAGLKSLEGLSGLVSVGGILSIAYNAGLVSVSGLENLAYIGGDIRIHGNPQLAGLDGLPPVSGIGGTLSIENNDILTSLSGLESLVSVGQDLMISNNPALNVLDGLENLASVGGTLEFRYGILSDISPLALLKTIGGDLRIFELDALGSLEGLSGVVSIGGALDIWGNDQLASLEGLENIGKNSISALLIRYNSMLSFCAIRSVCDYIADPQAVVEITGNSSGCDSKLEVLSVCAQGVDESPSVSAVRVYPNPGEDNFRIMFNLDHPSFVRLTLIGALGRPVFEGPEEWLPAGETILSMGKLRLDPGVYFILLTGDFRLCQKLVVAH